MCRGALGEDRGVITPFHPRLLFAVSFNPPLTHSNNHGTFETLDLRRRGRLRGGGACHTFIVGIVYIYTLKTYIPSLVTLQ